MKQFLVVMTLLGMSVHASSNPFDLQSNLKKIDQDQDVLLLALKEMADKKEANIASEDGSSLAARLVEGLLKDKNETKKSLLEKNIAEEKQRNEISLEEARLKKVKEEQLRVEKARVAAKIKEERLEVAAYEAQRLAKKKKLAKEELAKEEAAKKVAMLKEARDKVVEQERLKQEKLKKEESKKYAIVDLNNTREMLEDTAKADKAYLEAIKEMR